MWLAVGQLLFACIIWSLAAAHLIPTVRPLWYYGAIYYIVYAPIWIVNLFMSDSRSKELFPFALFANLFVFGVTMFVLGLEAYGLAACWAGTIPIECRDNQMWDIVVIVITIFLAIIDLLLSGSCASIIGRIRQSNSIRGIRIRRGP